MTMGLAGRLRTRLAVERFSLFGAEGAGGFEGGWTPAGALWAEMAEASEHATTEGAQALRRARWKVTARTGEVDRSCRLRWGARAFAVLSVTHDPALPDRMRLLVEEVTA